MDSSCLTDTEYRCITYDNQPHGQKLRTKAKIPLALSLQGSLTLHSAGEDEEWRREVRDREQRLAKEVNIMVARREDLLEAGGRVRK